MRIPEPYELYEAHEAAIENYKKRFPVCSCCREPIMSEKAYDIDGWYCEECFKAWVEDISTWTENLMEEI